MTVDPRAGKLPDPSMLANIPRLVSAYYTMHPDPARRYMAAVCWGIWMVLLGVFGVVVTGLLVAFPPQLIQAIAGLALLSTIGSSLLLAVEDEDYLEAAVVTFLVTLSGVKLLGIDSTVWGGVAGVVALLIQNRVPHLPGRKRRP